MIDLFTGPYRFLSNFYPAEVEYQGLQFRTVEAAYQAAKTDDPDIREGIAQLHEAKAAKKVGRLIPLREGWNVQKIGIMRSLLDQKFAANRYGPLLLKTYPHELIEGNWWHDNFWGICHCEKCDSGQFFFGAQAQNQLGKMLMLRREELFKELNIDSVAG